jgi:shikimate kinase
LQPNKWWHLKDSKCYILILCKEYNVEISFFQEVLIMTNSLKPADKKIIALVGMMGVGKTTIGFKLSERLGIYFIDSDQEIEDDQQKTIADIFDGDGEEYFREVESRIIEGIIARDEPMVLSLGGGSLNDLKTRKLIKDKAISVWLNADLEVILHRAANKNTRPLLNAGDKRLVLASLIKERYPIYEKSDIKVDTSKENHDIIVSDIIKQIGVIINKN